MLSYRLLVAAAISIAITSAAISCGADKLNDVTVDSKYKSLVGKSFGVIGNVLAHGIRRYEQPRTAAQYVELIPFPGIDGPEVEFRIPLEKNTIFSVERIMKGHALLSSNIVYVGKLKGTQLPDDLEVRIPLGLLDNGINNSLNPKIYKPLD